MSSGPTTPVYADFSGFSKLRAETRLNDPAALKKTAQQFEALFTQMMLKSMRATSFGDDGLGAQGQMYKDMFDQQLSLSLSAGRGIGIADMLVNQLRRQQGGTDPAIDPSKAEPFPVAPKVLLKTADQLGMTMREPVPEVLAVAGDAAPVETDAAVDPQPVAAGALAWPPSSRQEFLAAIWPHARRAADAIGVPAKALVAQAALETGWGSHLPRGADGRPSFNIFGIKADAAWNGARAGNSTHEVVDGVIQRSRADFRDYESIGHAFDDYVAFLRGNPRYSEALRDGGDGNVFVARLQTAGYATDPDYAHKIRRIAESPLLQDLDLPDSMSV
jgi:flagellar protein FlgJ